MRFRGPFDAFNAYGGELISVTTTYTVSGDDQFIRCNGSFTVTASPAANKFRTTIANMGTGAVRVEPHAGDTIEGGTGIVLSNQYDTVVIKGDGTTTNLVL